MADFAVLGRVLDSSALEAIRAEADAHLAARGAPSEYGVIALDLARHGEAARASLASLGARVAAQLDEDEVVLFQDLAIDKPPGAPELFWHRDADHLPLDDDGGLTMWIALDDADEANGCLRYRTGEDIAHVPLRAGEAVVHAPTVLHGSPPNVSSRRRRGWSLWWARPRARWRLDGKPHPFLYELGPAHGDPLVGARFVRVRRA
jgi:ectoine hydroxylase-related dioxygenase (phytanoyl-CoA dioxygenase family)